MDPVEQLIGSPSNIAESVPEIFKNRYTCISPYHGEVT
jgi:hypothetical protein